MALATEVTVPDDARPAHPAPAGRLGHHAAALGLLPSLALAVLVLHEAAWRGADGRRHWTLFDDAMISMSYARTLARTGDLVWFDGAPRTEGMTNLGWTLVMALLHRVGLPGDAVVLVVMALGLSAVWAAAFRGRSLVHRLTGRDDPVTRFAAVAAVATCFPLLWWSVRGMEVGVLVLLLLVAVEATLVLVDDPVAPARERAQPAMAGLALGAAVVAGIVVRTDFALVAGVLAAWVALGTRGPARRRALVVLVGAAAAALVATAGFRLAYYGAPVPNTYYLKLTGVGLGRRLERGLHVTVLAALAYLGPLVLVVAAGWSRLAEASRRAAGLLVLLAVVTVAYGAYVGGDAWEYFLVPNRYLTPAMVLLLVLAVAVVRAAPSGLGAAAARRWRRTLAVAALWAGLGPGLVYLWVEARPRPDLAVVATPGRSAWFAVALPALVLGIGAAWALLRATSADEPVVSDRGALVGVALVTLAGAAACGALALTGIDRAPDYSRLGEQLAAVTTPDARIAVVAAGATQYVSGRPMVDLLGKSDEVVAHERPVSGDFVAPGHDKYDFAYSIGELRPDVVAQVWRELSPADLVGWGYRPYRPADGELGDAATAVCDGHRVVWVRDGSPAVRRDLLAAVDPATCAAP